MYILIASDCCMDRLLCYISEMAWREEKKKENSQDRYFPAFFLFRAPDR